MLIKSSCSVIHCEFVSHFLLQNPLVSPRPNNTVFVLLLHFGTHVPLYESGSLYL